MLYKEEDEELFYRLALTFVPGIGAKTGRNLLEHFGSATKVFNAPIKELRHIDGIGDTKVKGFKEAGVMQKAEAELAFVQKNGIEVLMHGTPKRLSNCSDAPLLLYYKGNAKVDTARVVAIVGTRKNTDYGQRLCEELIEGLRPIENLLVVSGLALGIDAIAHKKSVQMGIPTIGVLGHGLDRIYPFTNKQLAAQMVENGGLLTEFPKGTQPERSNFPMRNRIVAGISDVTVVVESNIAGGALITALMASGYNREVAAYPGRVTDARSAGCNEIIRTNIAAMVTKPSELIEMMGWADGKKPKAIQKQLFLDLSSEEQKVIDILQSKETVHSDELYHQTGMPSSQLAATLLQLEMMGLVKTLPGKNYRMN